jgi:hypothetical protein
VSPRDWVGEWGPPADTAWALGEILRRYLDTYGPATGAEFARWFALDPKPTRQAIQAAGDTITQVHVDGEPRLLSTARAGQLARTDPEAAAGVVRLLPGFDPYTIGALRNLPHLLPDPTLAKLVSRASGWISPVLLAGGRIAGTWTDERKRGRITFQLRPFTRLPAGVRALAEDAAEHLAALADLTPEVTWEDPLEA